MEARRRCSSWESGVIGLGAEAGVVLRKRACEMQEAEDERGEANREAERLSANEAERRKQATAKAQEQNALARLAIMKQTIVNRRDAEAKRKEDERKKAYNRWLQTEYPADLARRLIKKLAERGLESQRDDRYNSTHFGERRQNETF